MSQYEGDWREGLALRIVGYNRADNTYRFKTGTRSEGNVNREYVLHDSDFLAASICSVGCITFECGMSDEDIMEAHQISPMNFEIYKFEERRDEFRDSDASKEWMRLSLAIGGDTEDLWGFVYVSPLHSQCPEDKHGQFMCIVDYDEPTNMYTLVWGTCGSKRTYILHENDFYVTELASYEQGKDLEKLYTTYL